MRAVDAFLLSLDHAWTHRWESLANVLDGIHPDEAGWQAPTYGDAEHEAGWPPPGSIHWQVAHIAHCKRSYTEYILQRDRPGRPPAPPRLPDRTWDQEVVALKHAHARQRDAIASLTDADLETRVGNAMTVAEFLAMIIRHDIWHASQIAVARRLYRNRR
jgi:uncharacterized damage-inducible protein DinB